VYVRKPGESHSAEFRTAADMKAFEECSGRRAGATSICKAKASLPSSLFIWMKSVTNRHTAGGTFE